MMGKSKGEVPTVYDAASALLDFCQRVMVGEVKRVFDPYMNALSAALDAAGPREALRDVAIEAAEAWEAEDIARRGFDPDNRDTKHTWLDALNRREVARRKFAEMRKAKR